jgi:ribosomal protein L40E
MQLRKLLTCLLIGVFVLVIVPSIHAQTTSVTILNSPTTVVIGSNGAAQFYVTAQVAYTGYSQANNLLSVTVMYHGTFNPLYGGGSSTPDSCNPSLLKSGFQGYALCFMQPSTSSGTETVTFTLTIVSAQLQQYQFDVNAGLISTSAAGNSIVGGSTSTSDIFVDVTNNPQSPTTAQEPPPQTYQTSQSSTSIYQQPQQTGGTDYSVLLLWCFAIAAVVIFGVWVIKSRKSFGAFAAHRPKQATLSQFVKASNSCVKCGAELPPASDFCNKCGTKQT